jgi:hypothetical protein
VATKIRFTLTFQNEQGQIAKIISGEPRETSAITVSNVIDEALIVQAYLTKVMGMRANIETSYVDDDGSETKKDIS